MIGGSGVWDCRVLKGSRRVLEGSRRLLISSLKGSIGRDLKGFLYVPFP